MSNLEYGNLYKFITSLGVLLIIAPFVVMFSLLGLEVAMLSETDYSTLSHYSRDALQHKAAFGRAVMSLYPVGFVLTTALGVSLVVFGLFKWHGHQKVDDERLDLAIKKERAEAMEALNERDLHEESPSEKCKEYHLPSIQENAEENEGGTEVGGVRIGAILDRDAAGASCLAGDADSALVERGGSSAERFIESMSVEAACFEYAKQRFKDDYALVRSLAFSTNENRRRYSIDYAALSKDGRGSDIIFEVKWLSDRSPKRLMEWLGRLNWLVCVYRGHSKKDAVGVLQLVLSNTASADTRDRVSRMARACDLLGGLMIELYLYDGNGRIAPME